MTNLTQEEQRSLCENIVRLSSIAPEAAKKTIVAQAASNSGVDSKLKLTSSNVFRWWQRAHGITEKPKAVPSSPLDRIVSAERQIKDALQDLDTERQRLHDRIIQIDNTVAKYKKLI